MKIKLDGPCLCDSRYEGCEHPKPCNGPNSGTGHGPWCAECLPRRFATITASLQSARDLATAYRQLITEHDRLREELRVAGALHYAEVQRLREDVIGPLRAERDRLRAQLVDARADVECAKKRCPGCWHCNGEYWDKDLFDDLAELRELREDKIAAVDRLTPGDTGLPQAARDLATAYRQLITEHDRLMARRAELILSGVDPDELLMPEVPLPPPGGTDG